MIVLQLIILNIHKYNIVKAIMLLLYIFTTLLTFSKSIDIAINVNVQFSQQMRINVNVQFSQ